MMRYHWPGNIRELQNIIERASVLTQDNVIRLENLPTVFLDLGGNGDHFQSIDATQGSFRGQREQQLHAVELNLIREYLEEANGNVSLAARNANIPRRTFYRMLERQGLKGSSFKETRSSAK
jgi:DNA-binding NtrC family response regulator